MIFDNLPHDIMNYTIYSKICNKYYIRNKILNIIDTFIYK